MLNGPFSPWPSFTQEEADAVSSVILSNLVNYWTGTECREFEKEFAHWTGTNYAIALSNGTLALDLALHGLGIGSANGGDATDEVIVTPRSFIASVSTVVNAGAVPVFADVDPDSGNLTAETAARVITGRTRGIIAVHLAGYPCDMDSIMALAAAHDIKVIEDCAQAHGAQYKGRKVGSIGHVGAWSFCQDKIMTTGGEGGMVTCDDEVLWRRMWAFKDHGKSWEAVYERPHPPGFRWLHESIGTNWRMMEVQGVLGRIQLARMAEWTDARTANARALTAALTPFAGPNGPVRLPDLACDGYLGDADQSGTVHAFYKYYFYLRPENLAAGWNRDAISYEINKHGVPCFQGSCSEIYLEKAFDGTGLRPETPLTVSRDLGAVSLMLLVHPTLTTAEMTKTCDVLSEVLGTTHEPLE
mgnify:CR=1 FL=1